METEYQNFSFFRESHEHHTIELTKRQFEQYITASLSHGERGPDCQIPDYQVFNFILTGYIQVVSGENLTSSLLMEKKRGRMADRVCQFVRWCMDAVFDDFGLTSILTIKADLDLSSFNLDGSQTLAKKGGESVAYQGPKKR